MMQPLPIEIYDSEIEIYNSEIEIYNSEILAGRH